MKWIAKWIRPATDTGYAAPVYGKSFTLSERENVTEAKLFITALGVYEAELNGKRVGDFILAPGWTAYYKRLQGCWRKKIP